MDFQQQRYMRPPVPPPPSMTDQHHYQQPPPPPPPPAQPQPPWFPGQFQYHSPSQWAPPPQSDHLQPPPYPAPPIQTHQYPPPPPPHSLPPRPHILPPHLHSHVPQSYPQLNQDWGNPNWSHNQVWEYPAHNHEEDLAARARAWAAANATTDNQSQFTPPVAGRPEEQQGHYNSHYPPQNADPHYSDVQQSSAIPSSNYQPYPASAGFAPHRVPVGAHPQDSSASFSSGYLPPQDGNFTGDANTSFHHHRESSSTSLSSVHQQEVPSSYSSVAGTEEATNQSEKLYNSMPLPPHQHYTQPQHTTNYSFGNKQSAEVASDVSDQPLDFAPRFPQDPHMQPPNYTHAWTPPLYPPLVDHASSVPTSAPMFGRLPGPGFQSAIPSVTAPFGMGTTAHPSTVFPIDPYGLSERPKKASVPNWLREEIIKKKPVLTSSAPELSDEEAVSFQDEGVDDKFSGKGDLAANSRSVDSSRSTEEEDEDDENYVEAAKTAAINQEIKRVLTEVLLKVTDELFDEIATKVLSEHDDLTVEVKHNGTASAHTVSTSNPSAQTPEASAKILIPPKTMGSHSDDAIEKSTSSSPGDVLGLGNYASDEDEDDAIQRSDASNPEGSRVHLNPTKISEDTQVDNGVSKVETEENHGETHIDAESKRDAVSPNKAKVNHNAVVTDEKVLDVSDVLKSKNGIGDKVSTKSISDDSQSRETRNKRDKYEKVETRSSTDDHRKKQDERHARKEKEKEKANYQNGFAEKKREVESVIKSGEKTKDSESRKRSSHVESKEDRKEIQRERRSSSGKESNDRKRERRTKDEKGERSRQRYGNDSSRHKRRRSSSDSSDSSSDESKRKVNSERRKLSPSPVRSRRRQVSRSPHSKHSQRRHSPYSSLETTRGRRSRSRSPVRRQR